MSYDPPFIPESRRDEESLRDRIARARRAREDAAERIRKRYAELEPDERKWRTEEPLKIPREPLHVR